MIPSLLTLTLILGQSFPAPGPGKPAYVPPPCTPGACFDDFTGVSGTPLATYNSNWVSSTSTYGIATLQLTTAPGVQLTSGFASGGAKYTGSTVDTSQITIAGSAASIGLFPDVRGVPGTSVGYQVQFSFYSGGNWTNVTFGKNGSGLGTYSITSCGTIVANVPHKLAITATGTSSVVLTATIDGTCVITGPTDSSSPLAAGGRPGFHAAGNGTVADSKITKWCDYLC